MLLYNTSCTFNSYHVRVKKKNTKWDQWVALSFSFVPRSAAPIFTTAVGDGILCSIVCPLQSTIILIHVTASCDWE